MTASLRSFFKIQDNSLSFLITLCVSLLFIYILMIQIPAVIVAAVIAYVLSPLLKFLEQYSISRTLSITAIITCLAGLIIFFITVPIPFISLQAMGLIKELPNILHTLQTAVSQIPEKFPEYISSEQLINLSDHLQNWLSSSSHSGLAFLLTVLPSLLSFIMYVFLVPLFVFFFLKDAQMIQNWAQSLLPKQHQLLSRFIRTIDVQLGHYIRAKLLELIIVTMLAWLLYALLGLKYSMLLALLVGVSVFIPIVGALLATLPILLIGYWQWGFVHTFYVLIITHIALLIVDGNILAPWLFSKKMNLHPAAALISILYFGGLWGFWGIFFAIPLATVCSALIDFWCNGENAWKKKV